MALLGMFLVATVGLLALWAVGAYEKWSRREGRFATPSLEPGDPTFEGVAERLARAAFPLENELQVFRDQNDSLGLVALIRGADPGISLGTTGQTTGDVEVGHLGFDRQFNVQGATALVRARLDGLTRDALLELARRALREGQLTVGDGQLRAVVPPSQRVSLTDPTDETVPLIAQVAHRLADPIDEVAELAKNARQDPVSGVRVLCLRTLLREYPKHASIGPLLREATQDADAEVRLEAGTALGLEGVAALNALVADRSVEDDLAARAAASLGPRMDASVARETLRLEMAASRARQRPATARACTAALATHGDPQDEPLLLALATDQRDEALRLAAVRALGQVGSANAVPSLADLASAGSADLRRAGREAIATIQARLRGATPGQLSLDPGGAGQIALADDAVGRLSEPPAKDER
jgi:hypothetical protein